MRDFGLWSFVKRSITPLGKPVQGERRLDAIHRDDIVDLHGQTLREGWEATNTAVLRSYEDDLREITVITGRSGQMRTELPSWLENHPLVRSVKLCANGGSYQITLKKRR